MKILTHLDIPHEDEENIKIDCLWCGSNSLSIEQDSPHQFQCFKCKETGNAFTLIRQFYNNLPPLSVSAAKQLCELKKGIKPTVLRDLGVRYNGMYWIPVYNQKGALVALHKYVPEVNIVYGSPKPTSLTVIGLDKLNSNDTVYVAEGHWDYFTAYPFFTKDEYNLLGTCGSYFSTNLLPLIKDKHIILMYDNDVAGQLGVDHVARHLKSNSIPILSLSYLDWSKITVPSGEISDGFDIRDLVNAFSN